MSRIVVLVILFLFLFVGYMDKKRHMVLFNVVWIAVSFINWVCSTDIYTPSDFTFLCIGLFVLFTNVGFMVGKRVVISKQYTDIKSEYILKKRMFYWVNAIAILFFFVEYTIPAIKITREYGIMYTRLYAFNASEEFFGSTLKLFFAQQILYALFFSSMMIGILELFNSENKRIWRCPAFMIGVGEMLLYSYTFKGRSPIFVTIFFVFVAYLLYYKWKKGEMISFSDMAFKRKVKIIVMVLVVVMAIMSIARFDGLSQLRKFLIIYFGGQTSYLSELIKNCEISYVPFRTVFCGALDFIKLIINRLLSTNLLLGSNEIGKLIDGSTMIGPGINMNAGCTEIFYFYFEFGVLGIIAWSILSGVIMSSVYNTALSKNNKYWDMLFLCVLYTIFYSYSGWTLKYLYFWVAPFIVRFFYKKYFMEIE